MKYFLCIGLFVLILMGFSECAPSEKKFTKNTENRPDIIDQVMLETIEREKLTCENLHQFCYDNQPADHDVADDMSRKACELFLLPYLCPKTQ